MVALGATLLLTGCKPEQVNLNGKTMGTSYLIRYLPAKTGLRCKRCRWRSINS